MNLFEAYKQMHTCTQGAHPEMHAYMHVQTNILTLKYKHMDTGSLGSEPGCGFKANPGSVSY